MDEHGRLRQSLTRGLKASLIEKWPGMQFSVKWGTGTGADHVTVRCPADIADAVQQTCWAWKGGLAADRTTRYMVGRVLTVPWR